MLKAENDRLLTRVASRWSDGAPVEEDAIRALVAAGRNPRFLMPDAVLNVIEQSGCYAAAESTAAD